jgi:hypothetical protein
MIEADATPLSRFAQRSGYRRVVIFALEYFGI